MVVATHSSRDCSSREPDEDEPTNNGDGPVLRERSGNLLDPGAIVDRYRIIDVVGTGGIGVVYSAFDDALGRKVALKLLRPNARNPSKLVRRRARLIREAYALARLSHPNVVPIYEVGMFEDRVYLAMEYVDGSTMRQWLRRPERTWAEIIDKYIQAGRGLAAAHAADIVHRDFKPDNVLVGNDGRVRVLDFGLATPVPDALATGRFSTVALDDAPNAAGRRTESVSAVRLAESVGASRLAESASSLITAHGKIMGTPAYMAPEQSRGEPIDARADQYSFCVSVWEALFGERPHGPPTATARIRLHRRLGERNATGKDVPPAIQRALERGLSLHPNDRFPDMDSLLAELSRRPTAYRRWLLAGSIPAVAAVVIAAVALETNEPDECPRDPNALADVWDEPMREKIGARLNATNRAYARASWEMIAGELDRWSERWLDARVDACTDSNARAQSTALFEMRMACLDRQLAAVGVLTDSLANAPIPLEQADERLEMALTAVLELPDPSRCERTGLVGGGALANEDLEVDERLEDRRAQLARARGLMALQSSAKLDEALTLVDEVVGLTAEQRGLGPSPTAEYMGDQALLAEAKLLRGQILAAAAKLDEADHELRRALFIAQASGHDAVTVEACAALVDLAHASGSTYASAHEFEDAGNWAALGHATLTRLGGDPHLEATLRLANARLANARGDLQAALDDQQRVLELREQLYGPNHVEVARVLVEQVQTKMRLGQHEAAEFDIERAVELLTLEFGITHPEVGIAHGHAAALARARGDHSAALSKLLDALAIFEIAYDERHPRVIETYREIASVQVALGQPDQALSALKRAHARTTELRTADDPALLPILLETAELLHALGRDEEARAAIDDAVRISANLDAAEPDQAVVKRAEIALASGTLHADTGELDAALADYRLAHELAQAGPQRDERLIGLALGLLASVQQRQGDIESALAHQQHALALREAVLAPDDPELALHLVWIGRALVDLERGEEARPRLERAITLARHDARLRALARFSLAELTVDRDAPAARELARTAIAELGSVGPPAARDRAAIEAWLERND